MEEHSEMQRELTAAMLQLRMRSPFFASLALFARLHITETVLTAATDGRDIYLSPDFWSLLTGAERLALLVHEVLHAALLHVPRRHGRDPLLWNIAADIVVNGMIMAEEGFTLPEGHIRNTELEDLSVEEVYHIIQGRPNPYSLLDHADLLPNADSSPQASAQLDEYWRHALQHARTLAKMSGHGLLAAGLERELMQLNPAQLDWRAYLWRFLVQTPTDFQGFDRRFIGQRLYLDQLEGEQVQVYVAVDTSGSIASEEIALFLGEVTGILTAYPQLKALLYYVDAACYGPYPLIAGEEIPRPTGGGGTDFRPFFEAVESEQGGGELGICVYLTDGYGTFPPEAPTLPVLWVLAPGGLAITAIPFGEAVRLIPDSPQ